MFEHPLRRHPFLIGILLMLLIGLAWRQGWFSTVVAFRSIAHDSNLGRETNQYTAPGPNVFLVKNRTDADALVQYLQLHVPPDLPHPIISHLDSINYDQQMVILVLQGISGGHSGVTVERVSRQWNRLLVDARFMVPGWGEGGPAVQTDAYDLIAIPKARFDGSYITVEVWDSWRRVATTVGQIGEPPRPPSKPTMLPVLP